MWYAVQPNFQLDPARIFPRKWIQVNEQDRIIGRINEKDGEFRASKMEFDDEGLGSSVHKGAFRTLEAAKAAVENI